MRKKRFEFKAEKQGNDVVIEGFANKAIVDSAGDLMKYDNIDMKRFQKNPILFFNHDRDKPIGKVIETKPSDAGLWVKAKLSNSTNELVQYVRDLVEEGILKTFSIGFDAKNEQKQEGVNVIDNWEMLELSVVTLPCNIDSEFSLSKRKMLMRVKGAMVAEVLSQYKLSEEQLAQLIQKTELEQAAIASILAGDVTPVPSNFIVAIKEVLQLSEEQAQALDAAVGEESKACKPEDEMKPKKGDGEEVKPEEPKPEESKAEGEPNDFQKCVQEKIPKLIAEGKTQEQAIAIAMSVCGAEGKCYCKKSVKVDPSAMPTMPINDKPNEYDFGNPVIDLMKSQLAMMGAMVTELKGLNAYLASIVQQPLANKPESVQNENSANGQEETEEDLAKAFLISRRLKTLL